MVVLQLYSTSSPSCAYTRILINQTSSTSPNTCHLRLHPSSICDDIFPGAVTSIRTCTSTRDLELGSYIHAKTLKLGLDVDVFIGNSLVDMYAKCGYLEEAINLFDKMPQRNVVSWTSLMSGYCQQELYDEAISLFLQMLEIVQPNEYALSALVQACAQKGDLKLVMIVHCYVLKCGFFMDNFLQNSFIDAYARLGDIRAGYELLKRFSCRDVVSWTSLISGCLHQGMMKRVLLFFFQMQEDGVRPNQVTILNVLRACLSINERHICWWIHGLIMKSEWCQNVLVLNSLVVMYSANGIIEDGLKIFLNLCFNGECLFLSPETMASFLQGCGDSGSLELGKQIHGYLIKHGFLPSTIVENSLIDMYGKNGQLNFALQVFTMMSCKDVISWNTMMKCLVKNEQPGEALKVLSQMHKKVEHHKISPDFVTMLASVQACADLATLWHGEAIHGYIAKAGFIGDVFIQNALIDMYGESGKLDFAEKVFRDMAVKDLGSWNSMIGACGVNGNGTFALQIFTELTKLKTHKPNAITFTNILSACAHSRLIEDGFEIFSSMERDFSIEPTMEHYACMVDLLGRSGRLAEAEAFIEKMPVRPNPDVWGALLGACVVFNKVEIAERVVRELRVLEPNSHVWRVAMSNIYAGVGRWEDAAKVREGAEERRRKEGGWSSVEVRGEMCRFLVADTDHPESPLIYEILNSLLEHVRYGAIRTEY